MEPLLPKVLFFMPDVELDEKNAIRHLVKLNYPGLLEHGFVKWSDLDSARRRRGGGFTHDISKQIVGKYNEIYINRSLETRQLNPNNMNEWESNPDNIIRNIKDDSKIQIDDKYIIPEVDAFLGRNQLVYTPFPKTDWKDTYKQEYMNFTTAIKKNNMDNSKITKYIVNPWRHEDNDNKDPMSQWNLLINQSVANIAVNSDPKKINMRIVLPCNYSEILTRATFNNAENQHLRAILLLKFTNNETRKDKLHTSGFIPLFVFHYGKFETNSNPISNRKHESHTLWNYRSDMVDWGDFSKRKTITYYELRDVMAHLAAKTQEEKWYMYKYDSKANEKSSLIHLFISKNPKEHINLIPYCINWSNDQKGIEIQKKNIINTREDRCVYDGSTEDFERIGDVNDLIERELLNINHSHIPNNDVSHYEENLESTIFSDIENLRTNNGSNTFIPAHRRVPSYCFGIYGEVSELRICTNHMPTAYSEWIVKDFVKIHKFHPLELLRTVVDKSEIITEEDKTRYISGGFPNGSASWVGVGLGVCSLIAMAFL
jgi:hypothetical protein